MKELEKEFGIAEKEDISLLEQLVVYLKTNELYEDYNTEKFLNSSENSKSKIKLNILLDELENKNFNIKENYAILIMLLSYNTNIKLLRHPFIRNTRDLDSMDYYKVMNYCFLLCGFCSKILNDVNRCKDDKIHKEFLRLMNGFVKPFIEFYNFILETECPKDKKIICSKATIKSVIRITTCKLLAVRDLHLQGTISLSNLNLKSFNKIYEYMELISKGKE